MPEKGSVVNRLIGFANGCGQRDFLDSNSKLLKPKYQNIKQDTFDYMES